MKPYLTAVCSFLVVGLLLTCRHSDVVPKPFLDGKPRLKSISFSGIPQENISIDQTANVISVLLPASIPNDIDIALELTDNAEWVNKMAGARSSTLFGCDSCLHIYLKDKNTETPPTTDYKIKLVPSAPLQVERITAPLSYIIRNTNSMALAVPMLHLYGNKLPKEARLTSDKTGEEVRVRRDASVSSYYPNYIHYGQYANSLAIYLYDATLAPGSYHIDLILDDGTLLKVPQPVLVTPGTPFIDYQSITYFGYRVAVGKTLTIEGFNLFGDDITLDLLDGQDKVFPLSNLVFDQYGRQIQTLIPATLSPGQYVLRVWQNDTRLPYGYCLRVNLLKDEQDRPILGTIGSEPSPCSLRNPAPLQRGVVLALTSNLKQQVLTSLSQRAVLKLASLTGNAVYYGSVLANDVNLGWSANTLTIPATVPPGLYTATLQVLDAQNKVVSESEPYGRILDVK